MQSATTDPETGVFSFTCLEPTLTTDYRAVYDGRHHWIWRSDDTVQAFDVAADPSEVSPLLRIGSQSPRESFRWDPPATPAAPSRR